MPTRLADISNNPAPDLWEILHTVEDFLDRSKTNTSASPSTFLWSCCRLASNARRRKATSRS